MSKICQYYFYIIFHICVSSVVLSAYIDDQCYHEEKAIDGICKLIRDCDDAIADLKRGIRPQTCGFTQNDPIVCCIDNPATITTTTTITSTTTTTTTTTTTASPVSPQNKRKVGEISREKCKEYENIAFVMEPAPILIQTDDVVKSSICPWVLEPTIIGGVKSKAGEFPHMALIGYESITKREYLCGGSLISERFVLTASHCISGDSSRPSVVRLGDINIDDPNDDQYLQEIDVKEIYKHPNFDYSPPRNDIGLLELEKSVKFSIYVKPICLFTMPEITANKGIITGWGRTENSTTSDHLLKTFLDIFQQQACIDRYKTLIDINTAFCAGSYTGNNDTCRGDSGGPLQIYSTDIECSHYIIGITSFGLRCGVQNLPAVYTKVYPYLEWIENIVWP